MSDARQVVVEVMRAVRGVGKTGYNEAQKFNFRGIDAVVNAIGPALRDAGGFITPRVLETRNEVAQARNGGNLSIVRLTVEFAIYGSEGEPISGVVVSEAFDSGDKATAKAMSVAYRTFLLQTFCLPTDEPDPDSFSYEAAPVAKTEAVDWAGLIDGITTVEEARALWKQAAASKAPKTITESIEAKVEMLTATAANGKQK